MKKLSTFKTLPLIAMMALGMALTPAISQAGPVGQAVDKAAGMHGGKGHGHGHKDHYKHGHGHRHKAHHKHYAHGHKHHGHKHHAHRHHGHRHHGHKHHGHGHRHTDYVVVHDYHDDYDPFRLMLGLHFDNIDIIYRDF